MMLLFKEIKYKNTAFRKKRGVFVREICLRDYRNLIPLEKIKFVWTFADAFAIIHEVYKAKSKFSVGNPW